MPQADTSQDVYLIGYAVTANSMNVKFKRLLNTGDAAKDTVISADKSYSWGAARSPGANSLSYHGSDVTTYEI